jgi:hypothetical protein
MIRREQAPSRVVLSQRLEPLELHGGRMYLAGAVRSMGRAGERIQAREIPQADSLAKVRQVVTAISRGCSGASAISRETSISARHVNYAIQAAHTLGLIAQDSSLTTTGVLLLETKEGSIEERAHLRAAVLASAVIETVAPDLLHAHGPSRDELADRIQRSADGLSRATALRRAQTLLAWRVLLL